MAALEDSPAAVVGQAGVFATTHWSVVLAAGQGDSPQANAALEKLCCAYWYPLYVYVRRRGYSPEDAQDLTQEFFARLLANQLLDGVKREGGKFRSFLLTALKCFLINQWHQAHAQKRGGGKIIIPIDLVSTETRYHHELADHATPEVHYERQWVFTVLDRVLDRLREEYTAAGKLDLFEHLKGWLPGAGSQLGYAEVASALQMNEPAVRMSVHRLRQRCGELLRAEIAETVSAPEEIDEEIRAFTRVFIAAAGT